MQSVRMFRASSTTDENFVVVDGMDCHASAHPVPDERGLAAAFGRDANG